MLRTLEIAWFCITVITLALAIFQFFREGWESAVWMLMFTLVSLVMYTIRRKQRIKYEKKDEKRLYH